MKITWNTIDEKRDIPTNAWIVLDTPNGDVEVSINNEMVYIKVPVGKQMEILPISRNGAYVCVKGNQL